MGEKGGWACTVRGGEVPCDVMQRLHAAADCYARSEHLLREGSRTNLWGGLSLDILLHQRACLCLHARNWRLCMCCVSADQHFGEKNERWNIAVNMGTRAAQAVRQLLLQLFVHGGECTLQAAIMWQTCDARHVGTEQLERGKNPGC